MEDRQQWAHLEQLFRDYIEGQPMRENDYKTDAWHVQTAMPASENNSRIGNDSTGE